MRVYNYQTHRALLTKQLLDDVVCCALHPAGSMLLVGMHDKLRLFAIMAVGWGGGPVGMHEKLLSIAIVAWGWGWGGWHLHWELLIQKTAHSEKYAICLTPPHTHILTHTPCPPKCPLPPPPQRMTWRSVPTSPSKSATWPSSALRARCLHVWAATTPSCCTAHSAARPRVRCADTSAPSRTLRSARTSARWCPLELGALCEGGGGLMQGDAGG